MRTRHMLFGMVFGFLLTRVGATRYDAIRDMFLLRELHLMGVIGVAIATTALGFALLRRKGVRARSGEPLALAPKPMQAGLVSGGLLFGVGWALAGTCPGTALAQIGHGQLAGGATFAGILLGSWLQQRRAARPASRPAMARAPAGPAGVDSAA